MAHRIRQIAKQRSADPTDNLVPECVVLERLVFINLHNLDSTLSQTAVPGPPGDFDNTSEEDGIQFQLVEPIRGPRVTII